MNQRLHLRITGLVQGVFYRASTLEKAHSLGLAGWVRNCRDGAVEVVAEGPRDQLEALERWCRQGPPSARVVAVDAQWQEATGAFQRFEVRH